MIDPFLILTPVLLLAVLALLGFVGCYQDVTLTPPTLMHVQTVVKSAPAGTNTVNADPLSLEGGEFIVVAVQWSSASGVPQMPELTGAAFSAVDGGGPFSWNGMQIQIFSARNADGNTQLTVTATLVRNSNVTWNLCVSAYAGVNESTPTYSTENSPLNAVGNPQTPSFLIDPGDLVYAVAFAANSDGTFPGNNPLIAGPGFTAEFPQITNPLVEDGAGNNPVIAEATNTSPDPNARGFIFAMGLRVATS